MPILLLLAAMPLQSEAKVEERGGPGHYEVSITTTMEQIPVAKQRMQAAMRKTCGGGDFDASERPLIINTNDVPMRFIIMQPFTCKPAKAGS